MTQAVLTSLVGFAWAAAPARAQQPTLADVKIELDELKKQINEMKTVQKQMADVILGRNEGLRAEDAGLQKRLDNMAEAIRRLDERVNTINDRFAPAPRVAGSSPLTGGTVAPRGTVRLVNDYFTDVAVVLNGVSHVLAPLQARDVVVAPGEFRYSLPQSGGLETRSRIRDGETVTLRIR
jgi:hypothetical protein